MRSELFYYALVSFHDIVELHENISMSVGFSGFS